MLQALLATTEKYSFWLPEPASNNAAVYDNLFYFILAINIIFSSLIMALMIYFVLKFRHRKGHVSNPTAGHSTALELTWTIIPTMLVLVIFYYGFRGYLHANVIPPNASAVTATGSMWKWSFTYESGLVDDELHLVVNKPTRMTLESVDVIHDLDIPAFRMKKDVVPGRFNKEWFEPNLETEEAKPSIAFPADAKSLPVTKTVDSAGAYGLYKGDAYGAANTATLEPGDTYGFKIDDGKTVAFFTSGGKSTLIPIDPSLASQYTWKYPYGYFQVYCAMYCGTGHSIMLAKCVVESKARFDKWMQEKLEWAPRESYVDRGKELYAKFGCNTCHSLDGAKGTGPSWKDLWGSQVPLTTGNSVPADDDYLVESIVSPSKKIVLGFEDKMPQDFGTRLKPADITALTWFMKSISSNYKDSMSEGMRVGAAVKTGPTTGPTTSPATAPAAPVGPPK
jgi:cytochrome c oxidase subunit 2